MVALLTCDLNLNPMYRSHFRWEASSSECSHQCGEGVRTISYRCVQRILATNDTNAIDSAHCPYTSKPILSEKCMGACRSAEWAYDEWGQVSLVKRFLFLNEKLLPNKIFSFFFLSFFLNWFFGFFFFISNFSLLNCVSPHI